MYSKRATSTSLRVGQFLRQISSALRDLKKLSTAELSWQLPLPLIRCPTADVYISERGRLEAVLAQQLLIVVDKYWADSTGRRNTLTLEV